MRRILGAVERAILAVSSTLLIVVTVVLAVQVFTRYVLDSSTPWSEELARYSIVWMTVICLGVVIRRAEDIRVDFIEHILAGQPAARKTIAIVLKVMEITFMIILVISAIRLLPAAKTQIITGLQVPLSYVIWGFVIGPFLTLPFLVERTIDIITGHPGIPHPEEES